MGCVAGNASAPTQDDASVDAHATVTGLLTATFAADSEMLTVGALAAGIGTDPPPPPQATVRATELAANMSLNLFRIVAPGQ